MVKLTGGGYGSKSVVKSTKHKQEPKAKAINPAAVDMQGQALAFKRPPLVSGPGFTGKSQGSTGIVNVRQGHAGAGPGGGGRTIFPSGSQSSTPTPKPIGPTRNTLAEFGPEISGPARRR